MKIVQAGPPEVSTDDVVDEIHDVVKEDRAESRRGKFLILSKSPQNMSIIFFNDLDVKKLSAR